MVGCCGGAWNAIERVKGFVSCWSIKEEDISIGVGYRVLEGYSPKFGRWTAPSFEESFFRNSDVGCFFIVDIYFVTVANGNIFSVSCGGTSIGSSRDSSMGPFPPLHGTRRVPQTPEK